MNRLRAVDYFAAPAVRGISATALVARGPSAIAGISLASVALKEVSAAPSVDNVAPISAEYVVGSSAAKDDIVARPTPHVVASAARAYAIRAGFP